MTIKRDELYEGGYCFLKSRQHFAGGMGTSEKLRRAKVLKVVRAGAKVEILDSKRILTVPFGQLAPDEEWLDERDRREEQKKKRNAQLRLVPDGEVPEPLTYSLKDKLDSAVQATERQQALEAINQLRNPVTDPVGEAKNWADNLVNVWPKEEQLERDARDDAGGVPAPKPAEPDEDDDDEWEDDEPEEDEPLPEEPPVIVPRPEPARPSVPPPPTSPVERLLVRIQGELESLIAREAEIEPRVLALASELEALREELDANRQQQQVLSAKERNVLAMAQKAGRS